VSAAEDLAGLLEGSIPSSCRRMAARVRAGGSVRWELDALEQTVRDAQYLADQLDRGDQ